MEENWILMIELFEKIPRQTDQIPKLILSSSNDNFGYEVSVTKAEKEDRGYYISRKIKSNNSDKMDIQKLFVEDVTPKRISCYALGNIWGVQVINI